MNMKTINIFLFLFAYQLNSICAMELASKAVSLRETYEVQEDSPFLNLPSDLLLMIIDRVMKNSMNDPAIQLKYPHIKSHEYSPSSLVNYKNISCTCNQLRLFLKDPKSNRSLLTPVLFYELERRANLIVAKKLLERGANKSARNHYGIPYLFSLFSWQTVNGYNFGHYGGIDESIESRYWPIPKLLESFQCKATLMLLLHECYPDNKELLSQTDRYNRTPLMLAATLGQEI